ncbi:hypothetical protein [Singapore grouper iridovirus]|nr:hypothetical protein [Singapore grouper iridovirus]
MANPPVFKTYYEVNECTNCPNSNEEVSGYSVKMQYEQMLGYLEGDFGGRPESYSNEDWSDVLAKGLTLDYGRPCTDKCKPFAVDANRHYCVAKGRTGVWQSCALPGHDNFGRECKDVNKDTTYGNWCYVKNGESYTAVNGGSWGYTHPALCFATKKRCQYGSMRIIR